MGILRQLDADGIERPYNDPAYHRIIFEAACYIEEAARAIGHPLTTAPIIATTASVNPNARGFIIPDTGEPVLMFEHGLLAFIASMAKLFTRCLLITGHSGDAIYSSLRDEIRPYDAGIGGRFVEAFGAYVVGGSALSTAKLTASEGLSDPEEYKTLTAPLEYAMLLFAVAHEYAHVIAGHLQTPPGRAKENKWFYSFQEEEEADRKAWVLASAAADICVPDIDSRLSAAGGDCLLSCFAIIERVINVLTTGTAIDDDDMHRYGQGDLSVVQDRTHPFPILRRQKVRNCNKRFVDPKHDSETIARGKGALALAGNVQDVLDVLWHQTRPAWVRAHEKGIRPSPMWSE